MPERNTKSDVTDEELVAENSLWSIYRVARKFKESPLNRSVTALFVLALTLHVCLTTASTAEIANQARQAASLGFGFSSGVLSFLIAGFSVYIMVTDRSMLVELAARRHTETQLPWIKYITFQFMKVMAVFVGFVVYCLLVLLLGYPEGLASTVFGHFGSGTTRAVASIALVLTGGVAVNCIMLLQSFIANIYKTAMMNIVAERRRLREAQCN